MCNQLKELQYNAPVAKPDARFVKFTIIILKLSGFSLEIVVKNQLKNNN